MNKKIITAIVIILGLAVGFTASAVCNTPSPSNFGYYRVLTINSAYSSTTQTSFVVLASTTLSTLAATSSGGRIQVLDASSTPMDIAFFDNDQTTPLNFEIESYVPTTGALTAWVRVADGVSTSSDNTFYVYYGYASGVGYQCGTTTWASSSAVRVWHLKENASSTAPQFKDSTGNNDGTASGIDTSQSVSGKIDGAIKGDGANSYVSATTPSLQAGGTYSMWFKPATYAVGSHGLSYQAQGTNDRFYLYQNDSGFVQSISFGLGNSTGGSTNFTVSSASWQNAVITWNGSTWDFYGNGVLTRSSTSYTNFDNFAGFQIGYNITGGYYNGWIDEVKFYNTVLATSTIVTDYNMVVSNSSFVTWGDETPTAVPATPVSVQYTISLWVKPDTSVSTKAIAVKNNEVRLVTDANGFPICQISNGTTWQAGATSSTALTLNNWQHIACVYDRSNLKIYIGGVLKGTVALASVDLLNTTSTLDIGYDAGGGFGYFKGYVDEFKFYKYARSQEQVKTDYNFGKALEIGKKKITDCDTSPADCVNKGLVGYWGMDENGGLLITDNSGNGNTGTLTNGPKWATGIQPFSGGKAGGGALKFDGVDDYVDAGGGASLNLRNNLSVFAWVKSTDVDSAFVSWGKNVEGGVANGYYGLGTFDSSLGGGGKLQLYINGWRSSDTSVTDGNWHYVGWTLSSDGNLQFYKDGVADSSLIATGSQFSDGSTHSLLLGKDSAALFVATMSLDGVRIYNRALSATEVAYQYNQGKPIAWYKMDEGSASSTYDSSGNGNTGTLTGGVQWTNGVYGSGLQFDGIDDYVDAGLATALGQNAYSVSLWLKAPNQNQQGPIVVKARAAGTPDYDQLYLGISDGVFNGGAGKKIFLYEYNGGGSQLREAPSSKEYADNSWHHVMAVRTSTYLKLYVDGVLEKETIATAPNLISTDSWKIGGGWGNFVGLVDDVKIYNYARTGEQVRNDYNDGKAMYVGTRVSDCDESPTDCVNKGLVGYWGMDEMGSTTVKDLSGNNNNGLLGAGTAGAMPKWAQGVQPFSGGKAGGGALKFDGVNDYVSIPANILQSSPSAFAISFWAKPISQVDSGFIAMNMYFPTSGFRFFFESDNTILLQTFAGGSWKSNNVALNKYNYGVWNYITISFSSPTLNIYVNGAVANTPLNLGGDFTMTSGGINSIGSAQNSFYGFSGTLDDVRIYNRALSAAEIRYQYNQGKPIAWWKMDEGANTSTTCDATISSVYDYSGNGNTGTLESAGSPATSSMWTDGKYGCGLQFDGSNDYAKISVINGDSGTFCSWIKPNSLGSVAYVGSSADEATNNYYFGFLRIDTDKKPTIIVYNNGSPNNIIVGSTILQTGRWYHICTLSNGSSYNMYVNGIAETLTVSAGSNNGNWLNSVSGRDNAVIGALYRNTFVAGYYDFNGIIDDVRIYNYARSADQIRADYNMGAGRLGQ